MKSAFVPLALYALITSCGAAHSSAPKAADPLAGKVRLSGVEARNFAQALANSGVLRQAADLGAFFVKANSVSCSANDACQVGTYDGEHTAPSDASAAITTILKAHGAPSDLALAATDIICVTYVNPNTSPTCTLSLSK